jgi:hypothetical protein
MGISRPVVWLLYAGFFYRRRAMNFRVDHTQNSRPFRRLLFFQTSGSIRRGMPIDHAKTGLTIPLYP